MQRLAALPLLLSLFLSPALRADYVPGHSITAGQGHSITAGQGHLLDWRDVPTIGFQTDNTVRVLALAPAPVALVPVALVPVAASAVATLPLAQPSLPACYGPANPPPDLSSRLSSRLPIARDFRPSGRLLSARR